MDCLRYVNQQIVWQEVPGEVSLAFTITGCPLRCKGCHSSEYRNAKLGTVLTTQHLQEQLDKYQGLISCVLFLGGEWQADLLLPFLQQAEAAQLRTCLYSGFEQIDERLIPHLTYLKTGAWIAALGGLDNPHTNQRFIDLRTHTLLNNRFNTDYNDTPL